MATRHLEANDDWIEWKGGDRPSFLINGKYEYKTNDGMEFIGYFHQTNKSWRQEFNDEEGLNIVAYRIIEPEQLKDLHEKLNSIHHEKHLLLTNWKEPEPTWPLIPYNVYRGSELLGMVEIPNKPGMDMDRMQIEAHAYLNNNDIYFCDYVDHKELHLHRISPSRGKRLGKLL